MKIETININGFKKLQQFSIDPAGKSVEIKGKNGQGKSSIIDAIWCTLTGKNVPGVPINKDSVSAKIVVGLDSGHTARLSFSARGGRTLVVEGPDGEPVKAPAAFLENLIGKISFDPFEFVASTSSSDLVAPRHRGLLRTRPSTGTPTQSRVSAGTGRRPQPRPATPTPTTVRMRIYASTPSTLFFPL